MHYMRLRKYGTTDIIGYGDADKRFHAKVAVDENGCWRWQGTIFQKTGYGSFWFEGKSTLVHRWAYRRFVGEIPFGLQIDHLCRVRDCCNPDHLEAVTPRENNRRSTSPTAKNAAKTHCVNGHEFTPENTYVTKKGQRYCITCRDGG